MKNSKQTTSILSSLLIKLGIILMLLLVVSYLPFRIDLSRNKAYSLSKVSKQAVRGLKDNMVVKIYASAELPAEMTSLDRYVKDLLAEYQMAGRGKFHYEFIRGLGMDDLRAQAQQNGLKSMYFRIYENDQTINKEVIYGLVFEYQGNFDALNLMPRTEAKLEYQLTLKIQKLARHMLPELGFYMDPRFEETPNRVFMEGMNANFNLIETNLESPIKQTKALVFTGAIDSLSVSQLYNLDQYVMKGGNLVMLQDRISTDGKTIFELKSNIFPFLENFGIRLATDIAMDVFCDVRPAGTETSLSFPIYPVLKGSQHPITRDISDIVMYMASGISFVKQPDVKFQTILATSPSSALLEGPDYTLDPDLFQNPDPEVFNHPPIPLGAIVEGKFTSFFANKPESNTQGFVGQTDSGKIVIFGDRELFIDSDKNIFVDRHFIVLNAVDWLLQRESMINVRSRHLQSSILDIPYYMHKNQIVWGDQARIEQRIKTGIKIVSICLPSLLLLAVGGFMALQRKQLQGDFFEEE
ncbi:MAG: Gldg family protein [Candidatus Cloacimonetes bacterium]|nr:Gldg family protein [Candidatus Cloacimonadota bacterium]